MSINQGGIAFLILLVGDVVACCHGPPSNSANPSDSEAEIGFDDGEKVTSCTDLVGLAVGGSIS